MDAIYFINIINISSTCLLQFVKILQEIDSKISSGFGTSHIHESPHIQRYCNHLVCNHSDLS